MQGSKREAKREVFYQEEQKVSNPLGATSQRPIATLRL